MQEKEEPALPEYFVCKNPKPGDQDTLLSSYNNPIEYTKSLFHRHGNKGFAKASDLPKVTQLVGGDELRI